MAIGEYIVELCANAAFVRRACSVNANRMSKWRRVFERGELGEPAARFTALLPVTVSAPGEAVTLAQE